MLFLGHFSFDELAPDNPDNPDRHGYLAFVVEAEDAESAAQMFKEQIQALKKTWKIFDLVVSVYLEDIFAVVEVPKKPLLIRFQSSAGPFPESISRSLPVVEPPGIEVFGWAPEVKRDEKTAGGGYRESEPFIRFDVKT